MNKAFYPSAEAERLVSVEKFLPPSSSKSATVADFANHPGGEQAGAEAPRKPIRATPFQWIDPATIPPRRWIYGKHYIRKFVSITLAPGGVGKSSLAMVEALAIATGRPLLGITPNEQTNVWLWNGEDPREELQARIAAIMAHYEILPEEVEGRLFVDNGRETSLVIARQEKGGTVVAQPVVSDLIETIEANRIGVMIVDPFVSSHQVTENDNNAVDVVAKTWNRIAETTGCAIELIHHVRKTGANEITVEDGRGAIALHGAARSARVLNPMTQEEADKFGVENRRIHFRATNGKANLAPPPERADWHKIEGVQIANGDSIAVVTSWQLPELTGGVTTEHMQEVRRRLAAKPMRKDPQSSDWAGYMVADVLGVDLEKSGEKARVKRCLAMWEASGAIRVEDLKDGSRHARPHYVRGAFNDGD